MTASELEARRAWIGASEAAAVLGVDPYKTSFQVWAEKTGRLPPWEGNAQTDAGNRFEAAVVDWAEEQLGPLRRNVSIGFEGYPIAATCDAVTAKQEPVEAKTGGLFGPLSDVWGRGGTDEIPERYIVQLHVQMLCAGTDVGHLAAFLGGRGFTMYRVPRSPRLADFIKERLDDWWIRHVVADVAPEHDPVAAAEVYRRIIRTPEKVVTVDPALVSAFETDREALRSAKKQAEASEAILIAALGDAEAADFGDGSRRVTFYETTRAAFKVKESKFRVLRVSNVKD